VCALIFVIFKTSLKCVIWQQVQSPFCEFDYWEIQTL